MQQRYVILLHTGYWTLYLLLVGLLLAVLSAQAGRSTDVLALFFAPRIGFVILVPNLFAFYFAYLFLFPRFLAKKQFAALLVGSLVGALGAAGVCLPLFMGPRPILLSVVEIGGLLVCLMGCALLHLTLALGMRGFITWYNDLVIHEELRRKNQEVEAALLRSKLDPHFLFNTLNNIDVLIGRDADAASHYLNQLCEILRFVLYETRVDRIPLTVELATVEKYIALQRLRVSNPQYVNWEVAGESESWQIAPMLLLPYIENAFKHAAGQRQGHVIQIAVAVVGNQLEFQCSNRYRRENTEVVSVAGVGNEVMERRLALLYPGRYTLAVSDEDERYTVCLTVELE